MAKHQGVRVAVAGGFSAREQVSIRNAPTRRLAEFFRRVLAALRESRRREAELVVRRYGALVDYASAHPFDDRSADAGPEAPRG